MSLYKDQPSIYLIEDGESGFKNKIYKLFEDEDHRNVTFSYRDVEDDTELDDIDLENIRTSNIYIINGRIPDIFLGAILVQWHPPRPGRWPGDTIIDKEIYNLGEAMPYDIIEEVSEERMLAIIDRKCCDFDNWAFDIQCPF